MKGIIVGQVSQIGSVETFGESGFQKRELIVQTVEEFPNFFVIEFTKDKMELLDSLKVGENIKVSCSLRGREHTNDDGKYNVFMSLNGWKIAPL